jgi:hypothetical protein
VAVADVWTAVAMNAGASSRAGRALFLFLFLFVGCEESKGVSRPNDRPTADAPTTVAVAQSCVTKMRQSWHFCTTAMMRDVLQMRHASHRRSRKQGSMARRRDISKQSKGRLRGTSRASGPGEMEEY